MPNTVQAKPDSYPTLTPYLIVRDADAAIGFYRQAFGAQPRLRLGRPDGRVGHAELQIADSVVMLADEHPEHGAFAPDPDGTRSVSLHLYVQDVDAVVGAAVAAGATLKAAVETRFYGDRVGTLADPFGHVWHVATHVEDVSPEEIERRAAAL